MGCTNGKLTKNRITFNHEYNIDNMDIPSDISWQDTIPFVVPINRGKVIKVFDGDTITIASKISIPDSPIYRFQIRLEGIDSPEMKTNDDSEKEMAVIARDELSKKILGKWVELENINTEKYGRVLAKVMCKSDSGKMECINDWMIKKRLAVPYNGGTKQTPKNWKRYYNTLP